MTGGIFIINMEGPEFDEARALGELTGDWSEFDALCDAVVDSVVEELIALDLEGDELALRPVIVPDD